MRVLRLLGGQGKNGDAGDKQRRHDTDYGETGAQAVAPRSWIHVFTIAPRHGGTTAAPDASLGAIMG
jgi:hypothetical protein